MSDAGDGTGPAGGADGREPVGSVGEEAAKLLGALNDWAREQGQEHAAAASGAAGSFGHLLHDVGDHLATDSPDCRYCPLCRLIRVVRETNPEVRTHLAVAAGSLVNAAAGLLATQTQTQAQPGKDQDGSGGRVEKIDLDDDEVPGGAGGADTRGEDDE